MPTTVTTVGQGGVRVGGAAPAIGQKQGAPPELHGNQWGLLRLDIGPRPEEK